MTSEDEASVHSSQNSPGFQNGIHNNDLNQVKQEDSGKQVWIQLEGGTAVDISQLEKSPPEDTRGIAIQSPDQGQASVCDLGDASSWANVFSQPGVQYCQDEQIQPSMNPLQQIYGIPSTVQEMEDTGNMNDLRLDNNDVDEILKMIHTISKESQRVTHV